MHMLNLKVFSGKCITMKLSLIIELPSLNETADLPDDKVFNRFTGCIMLFFDAQYNLMCHPPCDLMGELS